MSALLLEVFQQRIHAAISRSVLLKAHVTRHGRLLDCAKLARVAPELPRRLLDTLLGGKGALPCPFRLQAAADPQEWSEYQAEAHRELHDLLDRRIRRQAELARRETGVHALWLGYPLLHARPRDNDPEQAVLAPLLLWPAAVELDLRHAGQVRLAREASAGPVRANKVLWAWLRRQFQVELPLPEEHGELADWDALGAYLAQVAESFPGLRVPDRDAPLGPVPDWDDLAATPSPHFFHAAILGYWRWPNEAILEDLEALKTQAHTGGPLQRLLDGPPPGGDPAPPAPPAEADRYFVSDADFSQEQVVWQARRPPGLVVHGPPGTGKSQTIVNLIADALAHGRTVLMVCQKQAATQVVFERLRAAGLADLCLDVQDSEADRLAVFKALREQAEHLPPEVPPADGDARRRLAEQIDALERELDAHARALHGAHPRLGVSYRDILARQGSLYARYPGLRLLPGLPELLADLPAAELDALAEPLESLGNLFGQSGPPDSPWRRRRPEVRPSRALHTDVRGQAKFLRELDAQHLAAVREARQTVALPPDLAGFPEHVEEILRVTRALAGLAEWPAAFAPPAPLAGEADAAEPALYTALVRAWLRAARPLDSLTLQQHLDSAARARVLLEQAEARDGGDDEFWRERCRALGAAQIGALETQAERLLRYRARWWRFFAPGFYRARDTLQAVHGQVLPEPLLWPTARAALDSLRAQRLRAKVLHACQTLVPGHACYAADPAARRRFVALAERALHGALWLREREREHPWLGACLDALEAGAPPAELAARLDAVAHGLRRVPLAENLVRALARLDAWLLPAALEAPKALVRAGQSLAPWLDALLAGLEHLPPLVSLELERAQSGGLLRGVLDCLERYEARRAREPGPGLPQPPDDLAAHGYGAWWAALLRYNAASAWQQRLEREHPALLTLAPEAWRRKAEHLGDLLARKRALESHAIRHAWLARQVPLRSRPWKRLFQLRASKRGAAKRLREAVRLSLPEGLLNLRPCWLSNPETVAQVFPLHAGLFDLVIFDEASQCPLEQAVPVLYRGRHLVVCGDEKQLPPTSFFAAQLDEGEEDPELEASALPIARRAEAAARLAREALLQAEDLLQAAVGNLPERYLRVHYRSLHPALIDFSNRAFYGGLLEAPPAMRQAAAPILYYPAQGCYHGRSNRAEAEQVVELLRGFWLARPAPPSLGVITFNQTQRALIEDLLERACQADAAFAAAYQAQLNRRDGNQDTGFFVKNLENVQGDERDVILFSTTFGPDEHGRFYRRYGPVGAQGGERRLNVAVTRARRQVIVVGSMPLEQVADALKPQPGELDLTPAAYLQLYLAYAQAVAADDRDAARHVLRRLDNGAAAWEDGPPEDPSRLALREDLRRALAELGYVAQPGVGAAGFHIDLAVRHPDPARGYLLGIVCDGAPWQPERGARIQAVWRNRLLEQRGWRLHPVWSGRWWSARDEEIAQLKRVLEQAELGEAVRGGDAFPSVS